MTKPTTILIYSILALLVLSLSLTLLAEAILTSSNIMPLTLTKRTDAYGLNLSGTEIIARVDSRFRPTDPNYEKSWLDGQIVDIRPMGFHTGRRERKRFAIIKLPNIDYWALRGSKDWKSIQPSVLNLKKYLSVTDKDGYYPWEVSDNFTPKERIRDYFLDFRDLLDQGYITKAQYFDIYNKHKEPQEISLNNITQLTQLAKQEDTNTRLARLKRHPILTFIENLTNKLISPAEAISSGTYTICASGCDYATIQTFEADIDSQLTGNLTAEHADEETSISTDVVFDTDTNGFLLKITAQEGAEHNGGAYGNGARISYTGYDWLRFCESTDGTLDDIEISKLALDISGKGNIGVKLENGGDSGSWLINRILVKGDGVNSGVEGIWFYREARNCNIVNNIVYSAVTHGIMISHYYGSATTLIANNTFVNCGIGIKQEEVGLDGSLTMKNNLCQGNTYDYVDDGGGFGSTANNISEDDTSPDAAYRNTTVTFADAANDGYRLSPNDTSAKDQGEDLSAIFTDDIEGQSRSSAAAGAAWDIGADEQLAIGVVIQGDVTIGP